MSENRESIIGVLIKNPDDSERQTFPVSRAFPLTIGRAPDNDICLTDPTIRRHHCLLHTEGAQVYLMVESPTYPNTWINGTEVRESCQLKFGDVIVVGKTAFRFEPAATPREEHTASKCDEA